jgi:hypothetical protein
MVIINYIVLIYMSDLIYSSELIKKLDSKPHIKQRLQKEHLRVE